MLNMNKMNKQTKKTLMNNKQIKSNFKFTKTKNLKEKLTYKLLHS